MKFVTIVIADGSHDPHTSAAGYGVWVRDSKGDQLKGGPLRSAVSSTHAEMLACVKALKLVIARGAGPKTPVCLGTDCTGAIGFLSRTAKTTDKDLLSAIHQFEDLKKKLASVDLVHVPGHKSGRALSDLLQGAQSNCDFVARNSMRQERARRSA